jgi:hypothetical protein
MGSACCSGAKENLPASARVQVDIGQQFLQSEKHPGDNTLAIYCYGARNR